MKAEEFLEITNFALHSALEGMGKTEELAMQNRDVLMRDR